MNLQAAGSAGAPAAPITAEQLTKDFGAGPAVDHVDLTVPPGSIVGLIGPSGCGKTTMVRLLLGSYHPTAGTARLFGRDPTRLTTRQKRRIGYLPQIPIQFPALTVWENLSFSASLYGLGLRHRRRRLHGVMDFVELEGHEHKRVEDISGGMQRRLALAASLAHNPELLFLDEPTAGIDPILRRKFWDHFRELRDRDRTFLITTQYVGEAAYCDAVGVMSEGQLIAMGSPDELRRHASGGDILAITTAAPLPDAALDRLSHLPGVLQPLRRSGVASIEATVTDAATNLPDLLAELHAHDVDVVSSSEVTPDYDDVFVRLIEEHRAQRDADAAARAA